MTTPILELPPTWDAIKKVSIPTTSTKLGDGYAQIIAEGIKGAVEEWSIRSPGLLPNVAQDKLNQLRIFSGVTAFSWSPDNGLTVPRKTFTCESWILTRLGVSAHQISTIFKEFTASLPVTLCTSGCSFGGKAFQFDNPYSGIIQIQVAAGLTISDEMDAIEVQTWTRTPNRGMVGREFVGTLPYTGGNIFIDTDASRRWVSVQARNYDIGGFYDGVCSTFNGNTLTLLSF